MENKNKEKRGWSAFIIPAAVWILCVIIANFTYIFGYSEKKVQAIAEELFPTCTVTGTEKDHLGVYVYMRTEKDVDFFVQYVGKQSFYTNYAKAVYEANADTINNNCPEGVAVTPREDLFEDYSLYDKLYVDIDGEEYIDDAARYCAYIDEVMDLQCERTEKNIDNNDHIFMSVRFYDINTEKYESAQYSVPLFFYKNERVSYEEIREWMNREYEKMDF